MNNIEFVSGSTESQIALSWSENDKAILGAEITSVRRVVLSPSVTRVITCNYCRLASTRPLPPQFTFISNDSMGEKAILEPVDGQLSLRLELQSGPPWHLSALVIARSMLFQHSVNGHTESSLLAGTIKLPGVKGDEVWKTLAPKISFG